VGELSEQREQWGKGSCMSGDVERDQCGEKERSSMRGQWRGWGEGRAASR
jgi:hypothetical protein